MDTAQLLTIAVAFLSLVVSFITAYLTLLSRFKAVLRPKRRAVLTQVEETPCIVLECEFANQGARPGSIEDILLRLIHVDTGSHFHFVPFLVRDHFNIFENYETTNFSAFSSIALGPRERRELFVVFKPILKKFEPIAGTLAVHTSIHANTDEKWADSPVSFKLKMEDMIVENWKSPSGMSQQIESIEIGEERQEFLNNQN